MLEVSQKAYTRFMSIKNSMCIIRKACIEDIDAIMYIMNTVAHSMFVKDDREYVLKHIHEDGFVLVAEDEKVVAYLMIHYCEYDADVDIYHIAYMDSVGVLDTYRGKGLMKTLIQNAEDLLKDEYCYYMATVHPDNIYSLRVLESLEYECVKTVYRYNNNLRNLMLKKNEELIFVDRTN